MAGLCRENQLPADRRPLRTFANCSELDCIISDSQLGEETAALYNQIGVKVDYQS